MDLSVVLMCTTIGALVGTSVAVLLMYRKIRLPISDTDLSALKSRLETAETSLAAATTAAESSQAAATAAQEELRKQIASRDQAIQQTVEQLKTAHEQIDLLMQEAAREKAHHAAAAQKNQDLGIHATSLIEQRTELEGKLEAERRLNVEKSGQLAELEAQSEVLKRQIEIFTGQVESLVAESAALTRFREEDNLHRAALEAHLSSERAHVQQLTEQIATLQEERQTAERGMELLIMAQENFSRVFKQVPPDARNGSVAHGVLRLVEPPMETPDEDEVPVNSSASAD